VRLPAPGQSSLQARVIHDHAGGSEGDATDVVVIDNAGIKPAQNCCAPDKCRRQPPAKFARLPMIVQFWKIPELLEVK